MPDHMISFDENPDSISRIDIRYHRVSKIKPKVIPEGVDWEYVKLNYKEQLSVDRASETIVHYREMGSGCTVKNIYHVEGGISSFFDSLDDEVFSEPEGNPSDVADPPLETNAIKIRRIRRARHP